MNDKTKKWMISLMVIIIVLICFAIYLIYSIVKVNKRPIIFSPDYMIYHNKLEKADKQQEFFVAERCIEIYLNTLKGVNKSSYSYWSEELIDKIINESKQQVYSMLDEEYIYKYDLTLNSMDERFSEFYNNLEFLTENMYVQDNQDEYESVYFVYGDLVNVTRNTIQQYGFIVRVKYGTKPLFTIYPYDYMIENGYNEENIKNVPIDNVIQSEIEDRKYNYYTTADSYGNEYVANYYFNKYKKYVLYNIQSAYNKLDLEYRQEKFPTLQEFRSYLAKNIDNIKNSSMEAYTVNRGENYTDYICKDNFGNKYAFREKSVNEYTIALSY